MGFPFDVLSWLIRGRVKTTPPSASDGETVELQCTPAGRLKVEASISGSTQPTGYRRTGNALEYRAVAKASPGSLLEIYGFNADDVNAYALQIFDKATFPVANDVPLVSIYLKPGDNFSFTPAYPLAFATGIAWALSSDPAKYASVTSPKIWAAVAYL